jgi:AcrR family transcriptional regulator
LSEHLRIPKTRSYQMRKRAEHVDQTRQRIIEAAVHLHGTVGPAQTTIAGIARTAGLTRLTIYRHFPDEDAIFEACSAHWLSGQVLPNTEEWLATTDPVSRVRVGLADLYRFYRAGEAMLTRIYRDKSSIPRTRQQALDKRDAAFCAVLLEPFDVAPGNRRRLRAVLAHAVSFWTWRSLCVEHGLSDREAVDAMIALARAFAP